MLEITELSKIGFGGYRISDDDPESARALSTALSQGCNLIDTSANYQNGKSELLIGRLIKEKPEQPVFVVTKAGYIQKDNLKVLESLKAKGLACDDIVELKPTFKHSIHPDFLNNQIETSKKRLNKKVIDAFLLHNPEYYFRLNDPDAKRHYYERIKKAFSFLEEKVQEGSIRYYGISSNTFPLAEHAPNRTDLSVIIDIVKEISSQNHFKFIQFPYNLAEHTAASETHAQGVSLIGLAKANQIVTLSNRPLNVTVEGNFLRLAEYEVDKNDTIDGQNLWIQFVAILNARLKKLDTDSNIMDFEIIDHLDKHWKTIGNPESVDAIFSTHLFPFLEQLYGEHVPKKALETFQKVRRQSLLFSLMNMSDRAREFAAKMITEGRLIEESCLPLSAMVCKQYLSDGIDHVLVGMKKPPYVELLRPLF